jgi:hypothetical protein
MKRSFFSWIWILSVITGCQGISPDSVDFKMIEDKELTSGKRAQDLFYDIKFGMTRKEFFNYCWEMHQKGKFLDGENSTSVLYKLDKELKYPASMNFYPNFYDDKIYKMWAKFEYVAWAPWNKALFSDSLILNVVQLYEKWYPGNDFIKLTDSKGRTIYAKVDGNRRIVIGQYDDAQVKADYTDLLVERKQKK